MNTTATDKPTAQSAAHDWHVSAGANLIERDGWLVPLAFESVQEELVAARSAVVLVDLGGVGRVLVRGPGAAALAEHADSDVPQAVRTVRPSAIDLDDAPIKVRLARLANDELLILCDIADRGSVETWARDRTSGSAVIDVSSRHSGYHLIGPRSREVLSRLTSIDLRDASIERDTLAQCGLADVAVMLIRSDWLDEIGYEIMCPREFGAYVWTTLMDAGAVSGIRPMGLAAYETPVGGPG